MSRLLTIQLGAGEVIENDYDLRVDLRDLPGVNLVSDAADLQGIEKGAATVIKASHLIEHFTEQEQMLVLAEWKRVLAPNGILLIWTPDRAWFEKSFKEGIIDRNEYEITLGVGGRARYPYPRCAHLCVWDEARARRTLDKAQFDVLNCRTENGGSLFVMARSI
jgi:predicted SAM-dependent methyltransferase